MKLYKCDICEKELKPQFYDAIYNVVIIKEDNTHEVDSYDMCAECKAEVVKYIEDMKKRKQNER